MRKTESKVIGSHTYKTTQLGALEGRKVLLRLVKNLAPLLEGGNTGLTNLAASLKEEDFEYLCDIFARCSSVNLNGKEPVLSDIFDLHFVANYGEMVKWLGFCLEVNYSSFLGVIKSQGLQAAVKDSLSSE